MAYEVGDLDATLAAAAGEDAALFAELRQAFIESLATQIDLLKRSRCDGNWQMSALRIKGLAASFHAAPLIDLAELALTSAPGDPVAMRRIQTWLDEFSAGSAGTYSDDAGHFEASLGTEAGFA